MNLLVVGTLAFDTVETPFGKRDETLGGSASFLATAASYFCPVRMVGVVGEDFPEEHLSFYESRKIDISGVERAGGRTFRWSGYYNDNLNVAHTRETQLNVLETFDPQVPESYLDSPFVVLGNIEPTLQLKVLKQLNGPKLVACDTMNFWIEGANAALRETLAHVDIISINDAEARQLSGEYNLVKAAAAVRAMGPKLVIVKRGEHGALVFSEGNIFAAPAFPLESLRDPTGAGDSFAGGMMGYIAYRGNADAETVRQAVIVGSVMASYAVEDFSLDRFRNLDINEIGERFRMFQELTHFDAKGIDLWDNA